MELFYLQIAASTGAILFLSVALFEVLLALALPWGEYAWGGFYGKVLPRKLRIASALASVFWAVAALILLEQGKVFSIGMNLTFTRVSVWIVTALLLVGILLNSMSRSKKERLIWTPIAAIGFLLCLFLSLFS